MSYYMGDFYRGDPGIGSFFGGLVKKAVGFIPGVGPLLSAVMPGGARALPAAAEKTGAVQSIVRKGVSAIVKHPVTSAAAAAGALGGAMGAGGMALAEHMGARGGHKLKHCGLPLKSGRIGKCHRSMNVCNPRALRRAIRRTKGFAKLAMRTIHIVHPKKKGRFGGFKKRKRG